MNKKDAGVNTCIFFIVFFPVLVSSCKAYSCKESCMRKLKRRNKQEYDGMNEVIIQKK